MHYDFWLFPPSLHILSSRLISIYSPLLGYRIYQGWILLLYQRLRDMYLIPYYLNHIIFFMQNKTNGLGLGTLHKKVYIFVNLKNLLKKLIILFSRKINFKIKKDNTWIDLELALHDWAGGGISKRFPKYINTFLMFARMS